MTPIDRFGSWNLPFEPQEGAGALTGVMVDSVDAVAATFESPLGLMPVVALTFRSSGLPRGMQQPDRLLFVAPPHVMRQAAELLTAALTAAADRAESAT